MVATDLPLPGFKAETLKADVRRAKRTCSRVRPRTMTTQAPRFKTISLRSHIKLSKITKNNRAKHGYEFIVCVNLRAFLWVERGSHV